MSEFPFPMHPEQDPRTDFARFCIPCGCYAWKLGDAKGWKPCTWHGVLHLKDLEEGMDGYGDNFCCDCVGCRALDAGLSPYDFVLELWEKERIGRRKPQKTDQDEGGLPIIDQEDCGCLWHRVGSTWKLTACDEHTSERDARQVHRNARRD